MSPDPRRNHDRVRNSYRSWLARIRKERVPFLTIVSLELPESPTPLIESLSSRSRAEKTSESIESKDEVLDELLEKVTPSLDQREKTGDGRKRSSRKSRGGRKRGEEFVECTKGVPTLEECTRNIVEGQFKVCWFERLPIGILGILERVREFVLCVLVASGDRFASTLVVDNPLDVEL